MASGNSLEDRRQIKEIVREANDIVDVIANVCGLELKRTGRSYKACCPFHEEKTPSFHINPDRQTFKCFGCGEGGDVFTFVEKVQRVDFREALQILADRARIPLPESRQGIARAPLYEALEAACNLFQSQLPGSGGAGYLDRRGFSKEAIEKWRIGYAGNSWDFLMNRLQNQGFSEDTLERAGLIVVKPSEREPGRINKFDFFRSRVIFPIKNHMGKVVGFGGRTLITDKEEMRAKRIPKYLNTKETELYKKGELLFGLDFAVESIRRQGRVYVVEGYTDVIQAQEAGTGNTTGVIGTSFTKEHAEMIERRFPNTEVVCCYDGDDGGRRAALGTAKNILGRSNARVCLLPEGQDPADIIEAGGDLEAHLQKNTSLFEFVFQEVSKNFDLSTAEGHIAALKGVNEYLKEVPKERVGIYLDVLEKRLGISVDSIRAELFGEIPQAPQIQFAQRKDRARYVRNFWETYFLRGVLHSDSPNTVSYLLGIGITQDDFSLPEARAVWGYIENVDSESPLVCASMPLVGQRDLPTLVRCIEEYGKTQDIPIHGGTLRSFFYEPEEKPGLEELERAYLQIKRASLSRHIKEAGESGRKSIKSIAQIIRETEGKLKK
jgi:DNA primase